jgi:hypothetical protein
MNRRRRHEEERAGRIQAADSSGIAGPGMTRTYTELEANPETWLKITTQMRRRDIGIGDTPPLTSVVAIPFEVADGD